MSVKLRDDPNMLLQSLLLNLNSVVKAVKAVSTFIASKPENAVRFKFFFHSCFFRD